MDLKDANYPVVALGKKFLCVSGDYNAIIRCYRRLLNNTYQGTIYFDEIGNVWKCKNARVIKSLVPFWKKPFVADFVLVEPILEGGEITLSFDEIKKMVHDCINRASSFSVDSENKVFENERDKNLITQLDQTVDQASNAKAMIEGMQKIIINYQSDESDLC